MQRMQKTEIRSPWCVKTGSESTQLLIGGVLRIPYLPETVIAAILDITIVSLLQTNSYYNQRHVGLVQIVWEVVGRRSSRCVIIGRSESTNVLLGDGVVRLHIYRKLSKPPGLSWIIPQPTTTAEKNTYQKPLLYTCGASPPSWCMKTGVRIYPTADDGWSAWGRPHIQRKQ